MTSKFSQSNKEKKIKTDLQILEEGRAANAKQLENDYNKNMLLFITSSLYVDDISEPVVSVDNNGKSN